MNQPVAQLQSPQSTAVVILDGFPGIPMISFPVPLD